MARRNVGTDEDRLRMVGRTLELKASGSNQAQACSAVGYSESSFLRWQKEFEEKGWIKNGQADMEQYAKDTGGKPAMKSRIVPKSRQTPSLPLDFTPQATSLALALSVKRLAAKASIDQIGQTIDETEQQIPGAGSIITAFVTGLLDRVVG